MQLLCRKKGRLKNMEVFRIILLVLLVICSVSAALTKNTLISIIIFMSYSVVMSIIWALLKAPDLAITEAAVGAGGTNIPFLVTLKKIRLIKDKEQKDQSDENKHE